MKGISLILLMYPIMFLIITCLLFCKEGDREVTDPQLKGKVGKVIEKIEGQRKKGKVKIAGEIWWAKARSKETFLPGEKIVPVAMKGITLLVEKADTGSGKAE